MAKERTKINNITQLVLSVIIVILINYIASFVFARIDLTADKRYTLSQNTKNILKGLKDQIFVKIYLDGELPYSYKRLRNSTKEMLDEFRAYSGDNIQYEFINPSENSDKKTRNEVYRQLYKKGIIPANVKEKDKEGKTSQKIIFPGALLACGEQEIPLNLLKNNLNYSNDENLNLSIESIEYELISAIQKLITAEKQKIAFIEGHGEFDDYQVMDITNSLLEFYTVKRVKINEQLNALKEYDAIVIAGPDSTFSDKDKFIIDQFIMRGGKALWLIDAVKAEMDSLAYSSSTMGLINSINLDDQLFKYGARINANLIQDLQCAPVPVNISPAGAPARFELFPWYYFPLINPTDNHSITKNLNMIRTEFVSTIDTVGLDPKVKKTILLNSSSYTKVVNSPVIINLNIIPVKEEPDVRQFRKSNQTIAVLLEGIFQSNFANRLTPEIEFNPEIHFLQKSKPNKMIVISDADIIKNIVKKTANGNIPYPVGYDKYSGQTFGNKEFILNAISYLLDDSGLLNVRTRDFKLRLLDKTKVNNDTLKWKLINTVLPAIFIVLFGLIIIYLRKRKYSRTKIV